MANGRDVNVNYTPTGYQGVTPKAQVDQMMAMPAQSAPPPPPPKPMKVPTGRPQGPRAPVTPTTPAPGQPPGRGPRTTGPRNRPNFSGEPKGPQKPTGTRIFANLMDRYNQLSPEEKKEYDAYMTTHGPGMTPDEQAQNTQMTGDLYRKYADITQGSKEDRTKDVGAYQSWLDTYKARAGQAILNAPPVVQKVLYAGLGRDEYERQMEAQRIADLTPPAGMKVRSGGGGFVTDRSQQPGRVNPTRTYRSKKFQQGG